MTTFVTHEIIQHHGKLYMRSTRASDNSFEWYQLKWVQQVNENNFECRYLLLSGERAERLEERFQTKNQR